MFPLAKVLLPIDFSERCLGGARYAIPLVEHFHAELFPRPCALPPAA